MVMFNSCIKRVCGNVRKISIREIMEESHGAINDLKEGSVLLSNLMVLLQLKEKTLKKIVKQMDRTVIKERREDVYKSVGVNSVISNDFKVDKCENIIESVINKVDKWNSEIFERTVEFIGDVEEKPEKKEKKERIVLKEKKNRVENKISLKLQTNDFYKLPVIKEVLKSVKVKHCVNKVEIIRNDIVDYTDASIDINYNLNNIRAVRFLYRYRYR